MSANDDRAVPAAAEAALPTLLDASFTRRPPSAQGASLPGAPARLSPRPSSPPSPDDVSFVGRPGSATLLAPLSLSPGFTAPGLAGALGRNLKVTFQGEQLGGLARGLAQGGDKPLGAGELPTGALAVNIAASGSPRGLESRPESFSESASSYPPSGASSPAAGLTPLGLVLPRGSAGDSAGYDSRKSGIMGSEMSPASKANRLTRHRREVARQAELVAAEEVVKEPAWTVFKRRVNALLDNRWSSAFISCLIVWALLGTNVKLAATSASTDIYFEGITLLLFGVFVSEWLLQIMAKPDYLFSFFFFLDIVSAVSLLFDIPQVLAAVTGNKIQGNTSTVLRAARASQLGTRAARIAGLLYGPTWVMRLMDNVSASRIKESLRGVSMRAFRRRASTVVSSPPPQPEPPISRPPRKSLRRISSLPRSNLSIAEGVSSIAPRPLPPSASAELQLQLVTAAPAALGTSRSLRSTYSATESRASSRAPESTTDASQRSGSSGRSGSRWRTAALKALASKPPAAEATAAALETRVGSKLSNLITMRVIVLVLLLLFILPLFSLPFWADASPPYLLAGGGLEMLHRSFVHMGPNSTAFHEQLEAFVRDVGGLSPVAGRPFWLVVNGTTMIEGAAHLATLRPAREVLYGAYENSFVYVDIAAYSALQAVCDLCKNLFVILILGGGALLFAKDANDLVLAPIERLVKLMKDMADNPLQAQKPPEADGADEQYETGALRELFGKMAGLLQLGFGEAGAQVIADNLRRGGALQPMVPGKKCVAIFGFCDIRQFTDTTEVLQEGVMEFVNSIARIVHTEVALHGGAANKNIGDAFLLVWKFPEDVTLEDVERAIADRDVRYSLLDAASSGEGGGPSLLELAGLHGFGPDGDGRAGTPPTPGDHEDLLAGLLADQENRREINRVADRALAAFVAVIAGLRKSPRLQQYNKSQRLNARMPDFRINMGFGLHVGWAIEGAIGSEYKVDASYLSPNVNMASRLEAATKQFGVPLLMSDAFAAVLSPAVRARCRQIDRVTVKGSAEPVGLLTLDMDLEAVREPPVGALDEDHVIGAESRANGGVFTDEFRQHADVAALTGRAVTPEFTARFAQGYRAYLDGEWETARGCLEDCVHARRDRRGEQLEDGPSSVLLGVMAQHGFRAPLEWPGYRELTDK